MTGPGRTYFELRARYDKIPQDVRAAGSVIDREGKRIESRFASIGDKAGAVSQRTRLMSLGVAAGMGYAAKAASDLNETLSFTEVTFKDATGTIVAWSDASLDSMGIAKQSALDAANQFGGLFNTLGRGTEESARLSQEMVQLAVDMSSAKNVSLDEAVLALGSGLRGEAEPLRRFNVLLSEAALQSYAAKEGMKLQNGEMSEAQKVQARLGIIMEQTTDIQGDYARTADSAANETRRAQEASKDAAATLGEALAPVMAEVAGTAADMAQQFDKLPEPMQKSILALGLVGAAVSPLAKGVELLSATWGRLSASQSTAARGAVTASKLISGATAVATAAWLAYNAARDEGVDPEDAVAQVDDLAKALKAGSITLEEYNRSAGNVAKSTVEVGDQSIVLERAIENLNRLGIDGPEDLKKVTNELGRVETKVRETSDEIDKGTKKAGRSIKRFAGLTKDELRDWEASAGASLSDLSGAFADLADDAVVTADEILDAYREQIAAAADFKQNLNVLIARGAKPALIKDLIEMGAAGPLFAKGLAEGTVASTKEFFKLRASAANAEEGVTGSMRRAAINAEREGGRISGEVAHIGKSAKDSKGEVAGLIGELRKLSAVTGIKMNVLVQGDGIGVTAGGSASAMAANVMRITPGPQSVSSAHRPGARTASGNVSLHADPVNPANDIVGANLLQLARTADALYRPVLRELIYTPLGYSIKNGQRVAPIAADSHYDHVHMADQGGHFRGPGLVAMGRIDEYMVPAKKVGPLPTGLSGPVHITGRLRLEGGEAFIDGIATQADERGRRRDSLDRRIRTQS